MSVDPGDSGTRVVERAMRAAIVVTFLVGLRQRNTGAVVNAVVSYVGTHLPDLVERRFAVGFRPWQRAYLDAAMLAHAVGMLGPYDDVWWWDHVTHGLSSTLLGGFVHASARRRGRDPRPRVLAAVVVLGVLWEVVEYAVHATARRTGFEPVLVNYGGRDTLVDLVFNLVGALLVLAFGDRFLGNFVDTEG